MAQASQSLPFQSLCAAIAPRRSPVRVRLALKESGGAVRQDLLSKLETSTWGENGLLGLFRHTAWSALRKPTSWSSAPGGRFGARSRVRDEPEAGGRARAPRSGSARG